MEPNNNIENQFRQKLNERTIEPTDKAWDRLDAMLSVSEKKKSKRTWLWAVAGLAVLMTIGSLFFRTDNSEVITNYELQITNNETQVRQSQLPITNDEIITEEESEIVLDKKIIPQDSFRVVRKVNAYNNNDNFENENTKIAITNIETETNTYVTAQELLNKITDEKQVAEQCKKTSVSINHKSLLYQAEMEVETQYRKNAIDRFLQKSYDDVRVVVINKF